MGPIEPGYILTHPNIMKNVETKYPGKNKQIWST